MQSTTLKSGKGQVPTQWRCVLRPHDAADLLPRMSDAELRELGDDIKKRGLQSPVTIITDADGGERLLDGINRLDAMEKAGLPIVIDGELNPDIVPTHNVAGNTDPHAFVLAANLLRRHLTNEQKTELVAKLLKLKPNASDRQIAKLTRTSHPKVAKVRNEEERRGKISTSKTRTDTKGREQPARKPEKKETKTAAAQAPVPQVEALPKDDLATQLGKLLTALLATCERESNWPPLNSGRQKLRAKAMKKLEAALSELIKLASPAPRRGRPPKARAS
jgi:ParB-like nuclease domain